MIPILGPMWAILGRFYRAVRRGLGDPEFRGLFYATGTIVASGTVSVRIAEGWGWIDSLYFTVITLTTVGYGDLTPSRPFTKILVVFLVLVGIGILVAFIERVARLATEDAMETRARRKQRRRRRKGLEPE